MAITYQEFMREPVDLQAMGIELGGEREPYFCTPRGAEIFGWAGVDGIHYCFVPGFGETVFAVNPMGADYVRPLAKNFEDFLRLLLACGDVAALDQAAGWRREEFDTFVAEMPLDEGREAAKTALEERFLLAPMEEPFVYLQGVQGSFDLSQIPFSEEMTEVQAPEWKAPEWRVPFGSSFWGGEGRRGQEVPIAREFVWEGQRWLIPALYLCGKGIVMDFCIPVERERVREFYDKWSPLEERGEEPDRATLRQIEEENPLAFCFAPKLVVNGREMPFRSGCAVCWTPAFPQGRASELEAQWVAEHYGLTAAYAWSIHRFSFPWATKRRPVLKSLLLHLEQEPVERISGRFRAAAGEAVKLRHPFSGAEHLLTVLDYRAEEISLPERDFEFPRWCNVLCYMLEPALPQGHFRLQDCVQNDQPVPKMTEGSAAAIGIIGGADGPTAIFVAAEAEEIPALTAYSALHFEPVAPEKVEWQAVFLEKTKEDIVVELTEEVAGAMEKGESQ